MVALYQNQPATTTTTTSTDSLSSLSSLDQQNIRSFRHMVFQYVHGILNTTDSKLNQLDMNGVNHLIDSSASLIQMFASHGLKDVLVRFDRTLSDYEKIANLGALAFGLAGLAVDATQFSSPTPSQVKSLVTNQ